MSIYFKDDFKLVEERNGFEIRKHPHLTRFYVFLPQYDALYVENFMFLGNARDFCDEEDHDRAREKLKPL